jgi:hypothetical protein
MMFAGLEFCQISWQFERKTVFPSLTELKNAFYAIVHSLLYGCRTVGKEDLGLLHSQ